MKILFIAAILSVVAIYIYLTRVNRIYRQGTADSLHKGAKRQGMHKVRGEPMEWKTNSINYYPNCGLVQIQGCVYCGQD